MDRTPRRWQIKYELKMRAKARDGCRYQIVKAHVGERIASATDWLSRRITTRPYIVQSISRGGYTPAGEPDNHNSYHRTLYGARMALKMYMGD